LSVCKYDWSYYYWALYCNLAIVMIRKYLKSDKYYIGGWAGDYNIQSTNFCCITTCNERCINRVHLTFPVYTNCQNRSCGKEFNTTAFVNFLICNVNVNIILWRNVNILDFCYAFCGTGITVGAQYATLTVQAHHLSSGRLLFIIQYFDFIPVDNEVSHSVEITSWKRYLHFFTE
jgi:hypothetical protein